MQLDVKSLRCIPRFSKYLWKLTEGLASSKSRLHWTSKRKPWYKEGTPESHTSEYCSIDPNNYLDDFLMFLIDQSFNSRHILLRHLPVSNINPMFCRVDYGIRQFSWDIFYQYLMASIFKIIHLLLMTRWLLSWRPHLPNSRTLSTIYLWEYLYIQKCENFQYLQ